MADKGEIFGIGVTVAGAVATLAALAHGSRRRGKSTGYGPISGDLDCLAFQDGYIPGYGTTPGARYPIFLHNRETKKTDIVGEGTGIWFNDGTEEIKFLRDVIHDSLSLPFAGQMLLLAHSMKAARHKLGSHPSRGPLRGFSLWGIKAGPKSSYRLGSSSVPPRPFWTADTYEAYPGAPKEALADAPWRWYCTPQEAAEDFWNVIGQYPDARNELQRKDADPFAYAWAMSRYHEDVEHSYATGLNRPGGPWRFGRDLAGNIRTAVRVLHDDWGFTIPSEILNMDVPSFQEIFEMMCARPDLHPVEELYCYVQDMKNGKSKISIDTSACGRYREFENCHHACDARWSTNCEPK
jgi:hypothetical protein